MFFKYLSKRLENIWGAQGTTHVAKYTFNEPKNEQYNVNKILSFGHNILKKLEKKCFF